jgi:hypothetical protein
MNYNLLVVTAVMVSSTSQPSSRSEPVLVPFASDILPGPIGEMPQTRFDEYPAIRQPPGTGAPGVIVNALNGTILREGVTLWNGGAAVDVEVSPVLQEKVRQYFDKMLRERGEVRDRAWTGGVDTPESRADVVSVIRNSVCTADGEVYGRVLESVPRIVPAEGP